jgi:hypothetical protein
MRADHRRQAVGWILLLFTSGGCGSGGAKWVVPGTVAEPVGERITIVGLVRHSDLEGGFYTIRGNDSVTYDPTNLPSEFQSEGLAVEAEARKRDDLLGTHQVGPIVQIERIRRR